jgi:hypothetical protein
VRNLEISYHSPRDLHPSPWNPNVASSEDQAKLDAALIKHPLFKPLLARELPNGNLELVGGHWRRESAMRLGLAEVPVLNLGPISDQEAKEIMLLDNGRYGHDDAAKLTELLAGMGKIEDLATFLPYDLSTLEAFSTAVEIDLDTLGLHDDDEEMSAAEIKPKPSKTHEILRFKVAIEDADRVRQRIKETITAQGFTEADDLTNAGDALIHLLLNPAA